MQDDAHSNGSEENALPPLRRSKGIRKEVDRYCSTATILDKDEPSIRDPLTTEEVLKREETPKWHEAMVEKNNNLKQSKTLTIVERPKKRNARDVLKSFNTEESSEDNPNEATYRRAIGCLLYLPNGSRPDLTYAVCYMSQFCNRAQNCHWLGVKHIMRYLHETESSRIQYGKCGEPVVVYVDADWTSDKNDRRSFSGFTIMLAGGAVIWQTRKQRVIALSTVEAEYMAMAEATKEVFWLQGFLTEIQLHQFIQKLTTIHVVNQGVICLARNPITSDKSKHIDVKYHFWREAVKEGRVVFKYVSSQMNLADMFTKTIPARKLELHHSELGLV